MVVFVDTDLHQEVMHKKERGDHSDIVEVESFDYSLVKKTARDKNWQWLTDSEMPFKRNYKGEINRTLFEENKVKNLQINLSNKNKQSILICYFSFSEHNPLFGHASEIALTTENKTLIANMISNVLQQYRILYHTQIEAMEFFSDQFRYSNEQLKSAYTKIEKEQEHLKVNIKQFCEIIIKGYASKRGVKIDYSPALLQDIFNRNLPLSELKEILESALTRLIAIFPTDIEIVLEPWHLIQLDKISDSVVQSQSTNDLRYSRTIELLDRLEIASSRVKKQQMKLTGTTVGMHCETPISAPAITDALRKHSSRIVKLLKLYPDKWVLLRSDFRPLQNILDHNTDNSVTA